MKLYDITNDMRELEKLLDSGEVTPEMVTDTLEGLDGLFEDKARGVLMLRQGALANAEAISSEIERLSKLKNSEENKAAWLIDYLKMNMEASGKDKADLGIFKLTLKKPLKQLGFFDESSVPSEYWIPVPESRKLDKKSLLAAVKQTPIDGIELIDGKRSLLVR